MRRLLDELTSDGFAPWLEWIGQEKGTELNIRSQAKQKATASLVGVSYRGAERRAT